MARGNNFENYILGLDEYKGVDPNEIFEEEEYFCADEGMNLHRYKDEQVRKLFHCWFAAVKHTVYKLCGETKAENEINNIEP